MFVNAYLHTDQFSKTVCNKLWEKQLPQKRCLLSVYHIFKHFHRLPGARRPHARGNKARNILPTPAYLLNLHAPRKHSFSCLFEVPSLADFALHDKFSSQKNCNINVGVYATRQEGTHSGKRYHIKLLHKHACRNLHIVQAQKHLYRVHTQSQKY